ncbi:SMP-30/gluconolactonase/LRE family protein [Rhodococcus opacus]|jgi:sugar lactone lactonase YvrE|uniref:SMP-30/gluconolactonase/LRE family protein n=1 Tax=Rhodococcus opacus TaxID=37919 RepID=UPI0024749C09|nr:gluconolaconase [Rhodococcus opacus]MDH6293395.1 sugar lactone lactonase YvrE [Rhodococcus opacus]
MKERQSRWSEWQLPAPAAEPGWSVEAFTGESAFYGANGIQFGPDGRLYVAQAFANRVSAIDHDGNIESVIPIGSPITSPDDVAFDSSGRMYITDHFGGAVWLREVDGTLRLLYDDMPCANGLTVYQDRAFVNEHREGGRLFEVFPDGAAPRLIADDLPSPNGMQVGPDGKIYFPAVMAGSIYRIGIDGTGLEKVLDGLAMPSAVKFDSNGVLHTTCFASGEIVSYHIKSEERAVRATVPPGLDNLAFDKDDKLYVSSTINGSVSRIDEPGVETSLVPPGFIWPSDVVVRDGELLAVDGTSIVSLGSTGERSLFGTFLDAGFPGVVRAAADAGDGRLVVTTITGDVVLYDDAAASGTNLASGLAQPMGIAVHGSRAFVAESGTGKLLQVTFDGEVGVLLEQLDIPTGVAVTADGVVLVADAGSGRVHAHDADGSRVLAEGLGTPMGVAVDGSDVFVLDVLGKQLVRIGLGDGQRQVVARNLPVGAPHESIELRLRGSGIPMTSLDGCFAGIGLDSHRGLIYIAGGGDGTVLAVKRTNRTE